MIETVVSVDLMVEEELKVKKNHLAPDFPTEKKRESVSYPDCTGMSCRDSISAMR